MAAHTTAINHPPARPSPCPEHGARPRPRPYSKHTHVGAPGTRWERIVRAMPSFDRAGAVRLVGDEYAQPVSMAAIEFLLEKAAATVIPIRVLPDDGQPAGCEPDIPRHPQLSDIDYGSVVRQTSADGVELCLRLFDRNHNQIAELRSARRQCLAWRALVEWTLLRTGQTGTP